MVLWQSDLRISGARSGFPAASRRGGGPGAVGSRPLSYTPIWLLLLSLVVFDCVRSQRRIHARRGEIKLLTDSRLRWQNAEWEILGTPWVINSGMLLRLRHVDTRRGQHLWLAADSMDAGEWRDLRRLVLQNRRRSKPRQEKCSAISPRICSHQLWMRSSLRSYWLVSSSAGQRTVGHRRSPVSGW